MTEPVLAHDLEGVAVKLFAARGRRFTAADPELSGPKPSVERLGLPHRFEAVGEALISGSAVIEPCSVAGHELARDGASVEEALAGLRETWRGAIGIDPPYDALTALLSAWSETTMGYLHQLSCEDPLTGLSSHAHLRSRLAELYRCPSKDVTSDYALVVVEVTCGEAYQRGVGTHRRGDSPQSTHPGSATDDRHGGPAVGFTRALGMARAGGLARTVFIRDETHARVGLRRIVVLTRRDEQLGRRVQVLRTLFRRAEPGLGVRIWIEGLPSTEGAAGLALEELARS